MIRLKYTFPEVFEFYSESWSKDCLCFKGVLRDEFARDDDLRVIKFVSGGRRFKDFDLSRDGARVEGKVYYYPFVPMMESKDVKVDKELVRKIRLVIDKGASVLDTAYYFNVPYHTVVDIKERKRGFNFE